jgi:hypothetical protein
MQKYHMPNLEDSLFSRVKNEKEKKKKGHRRMNRQYLVANMASYAICSEFDFGDS